MATATGRPDRSAGSGRHGRTCLGAAPWPEPTLAQPDRGKHFCLGERLGPSGTALVADRLPQGLTGLQVAMQTSLAALPTGTAWLLRVALVLLVACMLVPLLRASMNSRAEVALTAAVVMLLTLVGVVYLACFLPWISNLLNLWSLALLLAAFVYWRHGSFRASSTSSSSAALPSAIASRAAGSSSCRRSRDRPCAAPSPSCRWRSGRRRTGLPERQRRRCRSIDPAGGEVGFGDEGLRQRLEPGSTYCASTSKATTPATAPTPRATD